MAAIRYLSLDANDGISLAQAANTKHGLVSVVQNYQYY